MCWLQGKRKSRFSRQMYIFIWRYVWRKKNVLIIEIYRIRIRCDIICVRFRWKQQNYLVFTLYYALTQYATVSHLGFFFFSFLLSPMQLEQPRNTKHKFYFCYYCWGYFDSVNSIKCTCKMYQLYRWHMRKTSKAHWRSYRSFYCFFQFFRFFRYFNWFKLKPEMSQFFPKSVL